MRMSYNRDDSFMSSMSRDDSFRWEPVDGPRVADSFTESDAGEKQTGGGSGSLVASAAAVERDSTTWWPIRLAALLSLLCTVLAFVILTSALHSENSGIKIISDLSKFHYIIQIAGFTCFIHAIVSWRLYPVSHTVRRHIHALSHACAMGLLFTGVIIRVVAKNSDQVKDKDYKFEPNLYTLHSMIAIFSLSIYFPQFIATAILVLSGHDIQQAKYFFAQFHKEIGLVILSAFSNVVSCGIQQLFTRSKCEPDFSTTPDWNPAASYVTMTEGCRMLNASGLLVYSAAILAAVAIANIRRNPNKSFIVGIRESV